MPEIHLHDISSHDDILVCGPATQLFFWKNERSYADDLTYHPVRMFFVQFLLSK